MNKVKRMTVGIVSLVFCVFLAACGTTESPDMPEVIQIQDIDEKLPQPSSSGTINNKEDKTQDIKENEEVAGNNSVQSLEEMEKPEDSGSGSVNGNENAESAATHELQSNQIVEQKNSGEDVEAKKVEYVSGSIESVGDNSFTLAKSLIMKSENGGDIAVDTTIASDKQIIKVTYTDSTEFIVCTSTDGITGQYSNGSAVNLQIGKAADLEGTYEGSDFVAQKVTIYIYNIG